MTEDLSQMIYKLHIAQEQNDKEDEKNLLFEIAKIHYENEEFEKSRLGFENLLEKFPKTLNVYYYLALIEINLDNIKNAKKYLNQELKINSQNTQAKEVLNKLEIYGNFPFYTLILLLINSVIFYFTFPQITFTSLIKFGYSFPFSDILSLFTSIFFHVNVYHFAFNMIVLLMFGLILEKQIGSLRFLLIYLASGLVGNFFQGLSINDSFVIGASGALFGMIAAIIIKMPLLKLRLFGLFKVPIIILFGAFFSLSSLMNTMLSNSSIEIYSGDFSHIMGMLTGFLIAGLLYKENIKVFYSWLLIFFGFWMIKYSFELIILSNILYPLFMSLIGIGLIFYSYRILKLNHEVVE